MLRQLSETCMGFSRSYSSDAITTRCESTLFGHVRAARKLSLDSIGAYQVRLPVGGI